MLLCGHGLLHEGGCEARSPIFHPNLHPPPPPPPDPSVCGQAFPIADGQPVNNFEFLRQVLAAPELFQLQVPSGLAYFGAACIELVHSVVGRLVPFEPLLTRAEVCKVGYTHYFNMAGVQRRLGYAPLVDHAEGMRRTSEVFAPLLKSAAQRRQALLDDVKRLLLLLLLIVVAALVVNGVWNEHWA